MLGHHTRLTKLLSINVAALLLCLMIGLVEPQISPSSDASALLKFKQLLSSTTGALNNWSTSTPPCNGSAKNWEGVLCNKGMVWGLQLENMSLTGTIDVDSLTQLPLLRTISLMNNSFNGPLPPINKLVRLRSLFLSYNSFSGVIRDDAFEGLKQLKKVYMAHNGFKGMVPTSLADLPRLIEVSLENNQFVGHAPDLLSHDLKIVNLSNNFFDGGLPPSLMHYNISSFLGNPGLCGPPYFPPCLSPKSEPRPTSKTSHKGHTMIIIIVTTLGLLAIITVIFLVTRKRNQNYQISSRDLRILPPEKSRNKQQQPNNGHDLYPNNNQAASLDRPTSYKKSDNGKLSFLRTDRQRFEMQDLLKASAEVLGSGSFGSSYKASIVNGPAFVVKRFKQMNNVGRDEFHEHMKRLGRLRHPNILPLVAFFNKRDEKLIISDFVENGSLASHLHGRRAPDQQGLKWSTRLKIIKGVARGLAYLYRELPQLPLPHGHLKSSNVLLDDSYEPLLSDYALSPLINKDHAEQVMVAYKSPEFTQSNMITKKTDVWCLGILILEVLTGKFPTNYLKHGRGGNDELAAWVNSVVKEEWSSDMFDMEMKESKSSKGQMLKLLKIGVCCCELNLEKRWNLREAVEKIEELKEIDRDDHVEFPSGGSGRQFQSRISSITEENTAFRDD